MNGVNTVVSLGHKEDTRRKQTRRRADIDTAAAGRFDGKGQHHPTIGDEQCVQNAGSPYTDVEVSDNDGFDEKNVDNSARDVFCI